MRGERYTPCLVAKKGQNNCPSVKLLERLTLARLPTPPNAGICYTTYSATIPASASHAPFDCGRARQTAVASALMAAKQRGMLRCLGTSGVCVASRLGCIA